jgi:hypothetical protein
VSATFASSLRTRGAEIRLAPLDEPSIRVRVEMPEVWDVVRVIASPTERVATVKTVALDALYPSADLPADFVVKYEGWEILDEQTTLADAGVVDGSILLLTFRRRRAVR